MNKVIERINKTSEIWFVLLIALYIPLNFYLINRFEAYFQQTSISFVVTFIVLIITYGLNKLILKNHNKALIMTIIITIIVYFYGSFRNIIGEINIVWHNYIIGEDRILFVIVGAGILIIYYLLNRLNTVNHRTILILKLIILGLISQSLIILALAIFKGEFVLSVINTQPRDIKDVPQMDTKNIKKFNIYHIVLDKYTSNNILKEQFDYDNIGFQKYLEDKGFIVLQNSHTNYPHSLYSLSSMLNLEYSDTIAQEIGLDPKTTHGVSIMHSAFLNNKVGQVLKNEGYIYSHIGSWYTVTSRSNYADYNYGFRNTRINFDEYTNSFLKNTIIEPIAYQFLKYESDGNSLHRLHIDYAFGKYLYLVNDDVGPKYIFAHILLPHQPFIYNEECELLDRYDNHNTYDELYVRAVQCANKRVKMIIDKIFSKDKGNAIIILRADEGADIDMAEFPYAKTNFSNLPRIEIEKRTSVLSAFYFPDQDYENIYDSMTSVNIYRTIFNQYLGYNFPLLDDRIYITDSEDDLNSFNFIQYEPDVQNNFKEVR